MKSAFVLLAGGRGRRFGRFKPLARLCGRPLIYWSLAGLASRKQDISVLAVALPSVWSWGRLKRSGGVPSSFPFEPVVATAGASRFGSLRNCLKAIEARVAESQQPLPEAVFVHDAARPLWPAKKWIPGMLRTLRRLPGASCIVPLAPVRETIKSINGSLRTLEGREFLRFSQTPQLSRWDDLCQAFNRPGAPPDYLDEAQIFELAGMTVAPYPGHLANIKLTFPQDLAVAEALMTAPVHLKEPY